MFSAKYCLSGLKSEFSQLLRFLNPLTPVPPVTTRDEPWPSTSDVITFDQNWHHLYSTSAGGKDLSNDV